MSLYLAIRDGGKTNEEGALRFLEKIMKATGITGLDELEVTEKGAGADASVDVAAGDVFIPYSDYMYHVWSTAVENIAISANASGNGRIDTIVAYVDRSIVDDTSSNNPAAFVIDVVEGTPDASPAAPDDTAVETAIGAGNPYVRLANIAVANGFSTITDANITDLRTFAGVKVPVEAWVEEADGSTVTFDMETAKKQYVVLGGNRTIAFSNIIDGELFSLLLVQDGTGSRTVSWPANVKWSSGTAPTLSTTANRADWFVFSRLNSTHILGAVVDQNFVTSGL